MFCRFATRLISPWQLPLIGHRLWMVCVWTTAS